MDLWYKFLLRYKDHNIQNSNLLYYIFNHQLRAQALKVGRLYVGKLTPEQRQLTKEEIKDQIDNKEGIYNDVF